MSVAHVVLALSCLYNPGAMAADFEQVIVSVYLLLTQFGQCQQHI